jgi:CheY-like chemotaxis protein
LSRTRVTVIDDDRDVLDLFRDLLTEFGYQVEIFADALPGIEQLIASRPDLIIVDLALAPEREQLTGLQVIHSARSGEALRDTPIIVSTASPQALKDAWPALMERGDIQQLLKPFDIATFQRVLETALGATHGTIGTVDAGGIIDRPDQGEQVGN